MEASFASFVALVGQSSKVQLDGHTLTFTCLNSPEVRHRVQQMEQWRAPLCSINGARHFGDLGIVADGVSIEFELADLIGNNKIVVKNLAALLEYQKGHFQCVPPAEYYLVDEKYAPGAAAAPERVAAYLRVPKLIDFLRDVSDAELPWQVRSRLILLAGKKLEIPICYAESDLRNVPPEAEVDDFREAVLSKPHAEQKRELLKRLLIRKFQDVPESKRFARLLAAFQEIRNGFSADLDHFLSEFDFERLRDQFERKRLDYMLKINATIGDLASKILAIPIAQGIVVSQLKLDDKYELANVALLSGSFVFTLIGCILILGHSHSLGEVKREALREREETRSKYPALYERVRDSYDAVVRRLRWFAPSVVVLTLVLLVAGFLFSLGSFNMFPPCDGCITRSLSLFSWTGDVSNGAIDWLL